MRKETKIFLLLLSAMTIFGCGKKNEVSITVYGTDYITYSERDNAFNDACRVVLREFSYKETNDQNNITLPYYGEGVQSFKDKDKTSASKTYLKTKDEQGNEYIITTIKLGKKEPLVIIETTNPDKFKLINALYNEFNKQGFKVIHY
jgi:hypothetical protein